MPRIRCARCPPAIRRRCHVICLRVAFWHVIICISSACFSKLASVRVLPVLSVVRSESGPLARARRPSQTLFSCAGVKHSRNGPSFAKRTWYSTGRPPVKFRAIWRSFDAPTVNRVTVKASFVLQPNTPPKWPKTHPNPLHALGCSITIAWPKTAPHLDSPSSQNI